MKITKLLTQPLRWSCLMAVMVLMSLFVPQQSMAGTLTTKNLPKKSGYELEDDVIYLVNDNMEIDAERGKSALVVPSGATCIIYIAEGKTLTLKGSNGDRTTAGRPAIHLPENSKLIITGLGTLKATGGNAGAGSAGGASGKGEINWRDWGRGGKGGDGGAGGGGAAPAIGGLGGDGGATCSGNQGEKKGLYYPDYDSDGVKGNASNSGEKGTSMGSLYVVGQVKVNVEAGTCNSLSPANQGQAYIVLGDYNHQSDKDLKYANDFGFLYLDTEHYCSGAGGPGGGGGSGYSAEYGIGGGARGGQSGSSGGSGGTWVGRNGPWYVRGGGGYGGHGGKNGKDTNLDPTVQGSPGSQKWGGKGGDRSDSYSNISGNHGTIWLQDGATISNSGRKDIKELHLLPSEIATTIAFDANGGVSSLRSVDVHYGVMPENLSPSQLPQYKGKVFGGYYTAKTGGELVYDASGFPQKLNTNTAGMVVYARWYENYIEIPGIVRTGYAPTSKTTVNQIHKDNSVSHTIFNLVDDEPKVSGNQDGHASQNIKFYNQYCTHAIAQTIYTREQVGRAGLITQIEYYVSVIESLSDQNIQIYMANTPKAEFNSNSEYFVGSNLTLVYDKKINTGGSIGWEKYTLDTPFEYNGADNLVVVFCRNSPSYGRPAAAPQVQYSTTNQSFNSTLYYGDYWGNWASPNSITKYERSSIQLTARFTKQLPKDDVLIEGDLKYYEILEDGELVRKFVPAHHDGKVCLFDEKTHQYVESTTSIIDHTNPCHHALTGGKSAYHATGETVTHDDRGFAIKQCYLCDNKKEIPNDDDYIEFNGQAYYDTQYAPNDKTMAYGRMQYAINDQAVMGQEKINTHSGVNEGNSYRVPMGTFTNDAITQTIYTKEQVGAAGNINQISFYVNQPAAIENTFVAIFMGHTSKLQFSSASDVFAEADVKLTHARSGITIGASAGWERWDLDAPFAYNGTDNLVVVVITGKTANAALQYARSSGGNSVWSCGGFTSNNGYTFEPYQPLAMFKIKKHQIFQHVSGVKSSDSYYLPFGNYNFYSTTQTIYSNAQVGGAGTISEIAYYVNSSGSEIGLSKQGIDIYMGHTSKSTFTSPEEAFASAKLTKVFSKSNLTIGSNKGWETYTLDTPFEYNGTDNLVVVVCRPWTGFLNVSFRYGVTTDNVSLWRGSNKSVDGCGDSQRTDNYSLHNYQPLARFTVNGVQCGPDYNLFGMNDNTRAYGVAVGNLQTNGMLRYQAMSGNGTYASTSYDTERYDQYQVLLTNGQLQTSPQDVAESTMEDMSWTPATAWSTKLPLYLAAINHNGKAENTLNGRVYEFALMEGGQLKHHYMPAVNGGKAGFYDQTNDTFRAVEGSGAKASIAQKRCRHYFHTTHQDGKEYHHCLVCDLTTATRYYTDITFHPSTKLDGTDVEADVDGSMEPQTITEVGSLNNVKYSKPMRKFIGWTTKENGTTVDYTDTHDIKPTDGTKGTMDLYALWSDCYSVRSDTLAIPDGARVGTVSLTDRCDMERERLRYGMSTTRPITIGDFTYQRVLADGAKWGTLCLPIELVSNDSVSYYKDARVENNKMILTVAERIEPNTPCIFKVKNSKVKYLSYKAKDVVFTGKINNPATGTDGLHLEGCFNKKQIAMNGDEYCYVINNSTMYLVKSSVELTPFHAYLVVDGTAGAREMLQLVDSDDATALDDIIVDDDNLHDGKYLKDDRIVIRRGGKEYNTTGVRIR